MNHTVNRESNGMMLFSAQASNIADEIEFVCSHLKQLLYDANGYMQDSSGQKAIAIVLELTEETMIGVNYIRSLAVRIKKSADLLEESDTLL